MKPICPECKAGKHRNCNGVGAVDDTPLQNPWPCHCATGEHPIRKPIVTPAGHILFDWDKEGQVRKHEID